MGNAMPNVVIRFAQVFAASILGAFLGMFYAGVLVFRLIDVPFELGRWSAFLATTIPPVAGFLIGGWLELKRSRQGS
jgi:hypothetical protein